MLFVCCLGYFYLFICLCSISLTWYSYNLFIMVLRKERNFGVQKYTSFGCIQSSAPPTNQLTGRYYISLSMVSILKSRNTSVSIFSQITPITTTNNCVQVFLICFDFCVYRLFNYQNCLYHKNKSNPEANTCFTAINQLNFQWSMYTCRFDWWHAFAAHRFSEYFKMWFFSKMDTYMTHASLCQWQQIFFPTKKCHMYWAHSNNIK